MTLALIDGDFVAYRAAVVQQKTFNFGGPASVGLTGSPQEAAEAALQTIKAWAQLAHCKDIKVALTGRGNFRKVILPSYKANRTSGKPLAYLYTVEAIQNEFDSQLVDGLEGDDILGILMTTPRYAGAICLSADKDMHTIPGRHLNPLKETKPVLISESDADYKWLTQTLTGDTCDGYTGIPKVGPKKAEVILGGTRTVEAMWPKVVSAYLKAKLTEEDALTQARVARILRRQDYDRETKEILLWHIHTPMRTPIESTAPASSPTSRLSAT